MDGRRFDRFARALATAPSRRRLLGLATGALLATTSRSAEEASGASCRGDFCKGDFKPACSRGYCVCYRRQGGGRVCASAGRTCTKCRRDHDCDKAGFRGYLCVKDGRSCCGGSGSICVAPCRF